MAAAHRVVINELLRRNNVQRRVIKDRSNPLENLNELEVFARYRFSKESINGITGLLENVLNYRSARNAFLPPLLQVLVFLRFVATGTFQLVIGDLHQISQSTVCRVCRRVAGALADLSHEFIIFPRGEDATMLKREFSKLAGFPNVIGCVDGTQIKIATPRENEADYVNRKGFHSLNIQMICNNRYEVISMSAKWPGSTHDARIWRDCALRHQFENGQHNGFLLGDSGYPCRTYLMTPFLNPTDQQQNRFNVSLCRTRVTIEQTFGILKRRFPILHFGIRASPDMAVQYITACVVLHNYGIKRGDIVDMLADVQPEENEPGPHINMQDTGNNIRLHIANNFF